MPLPYDIDETTELESLQANLDSLSTLRSVQEQLDEKDFDFAESLYQQFKTKHYLSPKQWNWVDTLQTRVLKKEQFYGNFDAIFVMFKLAHSNGQGLKFPSVRLLSKDEKFLTLKFFPDHGTIKVWNGGYAHYGPRQYLGYIKENQFYPRFANFVTAGMMETLHEFSMDPQNVLVAMAHKLGICMYCGSPLTDDRSKQAGYGPTCAGNYHLPWGGKSNNVVLPVNLGELFT